jgi:long-chain acyl-CoA synthetase
VPVNWHQVEGEVAHILGDSAAGVFVAHERFAGTAGQAAGLAGIKHRFAVGAVPGFEPIGRLGDDGPDGRPQVRTHGAPMLYTSGTSGRPKGVRRPLTGADPDAAAATAAWFFTCSAWRRSTATCTCAARRFTTPPCSISPPSRSSSAIPWS